MPTNDSPHTPDSTDDDGLHIAVPTNPELTPAAIIDLLSHPDRRIVGLYLLYSTDMVTLTELATVLRDHKTDAPAPQTADDDDQLENLRIQLHHQHLPHFANTGVITYDHDTHLISTTDQFTDLAPFLTLIAQYSPHFPPNDTHDPSPTSNVSE